MSNEFVVQHEGRRSQDDTHNFFFDFGSCMNDDLIIGMRKACWLKWG